MVGEGHDQANLLAALFPCSPEAPPVSIFKSFQDGTLVCVYMRRPPSVQLLQTDPNPPAFLLETGCEA